MDAQRKLQRKISFILLLLVLIMGGFFALTRFITDFMWFREMGYIDVFLKQLKTMLTVGIPTFIVVTALLRVYLNHLRKGYFAKIASGENTDMKKLKVITLLFSVVAGLIATVTAVSQLWFEILKFLNSTDFNIKDPLFNMDISFYVFKLEFLTQLNELLIGVIIGFALLTLLYYAVLLAVRTPDVFKADAPYQQAEAARQADGEERYTGEGNPFNRAGQGVDPTDFFGKFAEAVTGRKFERRQVKPKKQFDDDNFKQLMNIASGKITILAVIFFIMLAANFFLRQFDLLHVHTGAVYGAGFTDVNITLWVYRLLCLLSLVSGVMVAVRMKKKEYKKILTLPVIMIVVGLIGTGAATLIQNFVVSSAELSMESKYLEWNIKYTQYAYGIDKVQAQSFAADDKLTAEDIANNMETINNIRINDFEPAEQFYNQTQSIRQYYTFNDVDNDRYTINGKFTQTFLTAREIDETKTKDTWLNRHLKYTHGYGVAMSRVDKITPSGQPDVLIGNIPPISKVDEIKITRPEIYFGELANDYIVVGTSEDEFDYPDGAANAYTRYEGDAGIKLNLINRMLFSIREGSAKLLVSSNINSSSRIIINRNITRRAQTIMPYLRYENDPYMVTVDGKLYWMIDAYTTSGYYPYAEPYGEDGNVNYIRNSIKVIIDAYSGETNYYIVDKTDPIAQTMAKIYPTLFKDFEKMPESLRAHMRYPNNMFKIQAEVYGRYHMNDVNVFYQNEDQWDIASEIYGMEKAQMRPSYYIAKLPGQEKAEFFNSIPFTTKGKPNMTALMVARNDGEAYGDLVLYQFPKSRVIYGPEQIEAQIDQNTEISKEFSLWNSSGSTYRRGNLFVIPIETSILYVEPVYLEAQNSSIPEVKRIIVAYKDKIAYKETLAECLVELFGNDAEKGVDDENITNPRGETDPKDADVQALADKALKAYEQAVKAQKDGDWAAYGKHLEELQEYLNELAQ